MLPGTPSFRYLIGTLNINFFERNDLHRAFFESTNRPLHLHTPTCAIRLTFRYTKNILFLATGATGDRFSWN